MTMTRIKTRDGGMVAYDGAGALRPGLTEAMVEEYVRVLVDESEVRYGHLAVTQPSPRCLRAVRTVWSVVAPGWACDIADRHSPIADADLAKLITHDCIAFHLTRVGARLYAPGRAAALQAIERRPELATELVEGYLGYGHSMARHTLAALLAEEGSCVARRVRELDLDSYGADIVVFRQASVRSTPVETYIATLVGETES
jgi:hypothetical protein